MLKFEDVEHFFSASTVKEGYEKPNNLKFGLRLLVGVFFSFGSIAGFLGAKAVFSSDKNLAKPLDMMNEYRLLLPSGVVLFLVFLFFYIQLEFISLRYRKTNKILYSYLLQIWMVEIAVVAFVSFFVMSQSFMTVKLLRYLYTVLGGMAVLYNIYKTIRMVKAMNHSQKFQDGINEWIKTYQKYLILGVVAIWFINMFMRVFNGSGEQFKLIELFLPLLPLIPIALSFLLPSLIKTVTKVYYLNKYSENFRRKFNVPEEVWYGSKYRK